MSMSLPRIVAVRVILNAHFNQHLIHVSIVNYGKIALGIKVRKSRGQ
ncbi:hypothetical protein Vsou_03560 [Vulcanisaeta souniana JCM 11219]|uniref:Uncharacterized protein n=1 Tax=Vulcanisaeta souniana JCM 11219 TaxID=1293586 RepID=A0ABM8BJZ1_9CREN|nr:hypothetical protein Vsou_03560 [Vulcanisaeta souniana JCM 11219]